VHYHKGRRHGISLDIHYSCTERQKIVSRVTFYQNDIPFGVVWKREIGNGFTVSGILLTYFGAMKMYPNQDLLNLTFYKKNNLSNNIFSQINDSLYEIFYQIHDSSNQKITFFTKFMICRIPLSIHVCTFLCTCDPVSCPNCQAKSMPNFEQTSTPTQGRFLTQV